MGNDMTNKEIRDAAVKKVMWDVGHTCNPVTQYIADAVVEKSVQDDAAEALIEKKRTLIEFIGGASEPVINPDSEAYDYWPDEQGDDEIRTLGNREFNLDDFTMELSDCTDGFAVRLKKSFEEIYNFSELGLTLDELSASVWIVDDEVQDNYLIISNTGDAPDIIIEELSEREKKIFALAAAKCKIAQLQELSEELEAEIKEAEAE